MSRPKENNTNEYLKTKIMTASPEELQLMLYDGAIRFCEQGRMAIQDNKIEESYKLLVKAQNIIMEMCNSLRDEISPETCHNMRMLYIFIYEKLVNANIQKSTHELDEAMKVLRHMRETWILLMKKLEEERNTGISDSRQGEGLSEHASAMSASAAAYANEIGSTISFEG